MRFDSKSTRLYLAVSLAMAILLMVSAVFVTTFGSSSSGVTTGCNGCTSLAFSVPVSQNDVVILQVALSPQSVAALQGGGHVFPHSIRSVVTNVSTSPHISIANRFTETKSYADGTWVWEFYGVAISTTSEQLTVSLNTSASWNMIAYPISGANLSHIFDPYPTLPIQDFNDCNSSSGCAIWYSTSNAHDEVIFGIASQGNPSIVPPAGWTSIAQAYYTGYMASAVAFQITSSPQSVKGTGNWALNPGESALWFVDAIQLTGATSSSSSSSSSSASSTTSTSSSSTTQTTTIVTSTCTVTFTMSGNSVKGWAANC